MTRLVSLYPRWWRDRYEAELLDLLDQRALSSRDALDLVRGALDAHVHPQADRAAMPWTHRLPGIAVVATGLLWVAAVASLFDESGNGADQDLGVAAVTILLGLPGDYMMAYGRRIAAGFGIVALAIGLMFSLPSELAGLLGFGVVGLVLGGSLTMAAIRSGIGVARRWILFAGTVVVPLAVGLSVAVSGFADEAIGRALAVLLALPYGLAWTILGIRMVVRGAPTIIDPPPTLERPTAAVEMPA